MITRLECVSNRHYKFWEAELRDDSTTLITRWGRIGTTGQSKSYPFASHQNADSEYRKKIDEKLRKGYVVISRSHSNPTTPTAPEPSSHALAPDPEVAHEAKTSGHRSLASWMSL